MTFLLLSLPSKYDDARPIPLIMAVNCLHSRSYPVQ